MKWGVQIKTKVIANGGRKIWINVEVRMTHLHMYAKREVIQVELNRRIGG